MIGESWGYRVGSSPLRRFLVHTSNKPNISPGEYISHNLNIKWEWRNFRNGIDISDLAQVRQAPTVVCIQTGRLNKGNQ
jgi:hypothetical protein